jgi:glycerophosphoryl diester phosphodiesterase
MGLGQVDFTKPLIIGHRGYRGKYPENTLAGFLAAIEAGADMIEFDVRLSRDGFPMVIHDARLERTTNGNGTVFDRSLAELQKLDAGAWFHPRFTGERIPTLDEVLDMARKQIPVNIEIKVDATEPPHFWRGIEEKVLNSVYRCGTCDEVLISSFNRDVLETLCRIDRAPAIGVLSKFGEEQSGLDACKEFEAFSWHPYYLGLTVQEVADAHDQGVRVMPYTINAIEDIRRLFQMQVDGIFTDDPAKAGRIRDETG